MKSPCDQDIIDSWANNAQPWISVIQHDRLESRLLVTNQAIIDTVVSHLNLQEKSATDQQSVLDLGCGEGWLCRELSARNLKVTGVDVVPALIEQARKQDDSDYFVLSYDEVAQGLLSQSFDAVICNFSLLGKACVERLFDVVHTLLNPDGVFIVQTVHPDNIQSDGGVWLNESWQGFDEKFPAPAPWYFRARDNWEKLFARRQLSLLSVIEPRHPETDQRMSLILVGQKSL